MNILFIATVYNHLAAFHKPFIKLFQDNGYTVHAAGSNSMGRKEELEVMEVICHDINFDKGLISDKNKKALNELNDLFDSIQFDLIHVHTPIAAFLVRYALKNKENQGSLVYTAHGFHFFKGAPLKNWLFYYPAERIAANWTNHLITINLEDYNSALQFLPKDKVSLVAGVGVELAAKSLSIEEKILFKSELGVEKETIVVSYIAELNKNKNHLFLLDNWNEIQCKIPNIRLLIIGTGKEESKLKEYVQRKNLRGVLFLGYRNDVTKILQISDIVSLLSLREGLPKSIMEAMASGLPCVVSNTRGLRDLIKSNETGFVINHNDNKALIEAFTTLVEIPELKIKMGENATFAVQPFLLKNVMDEYKNIYNSLLNTSLK